MRIVGFICLLFLTTLSFGQSMGEIKKGEHSIKLLKAQNSYSLIYSDVNYETSKIEHCINFSIKESLYKIIMDGFKNVNNHQIIVKTANDTIVKLEYKTIKGKQLLKIKQNNLSVNTFGTSTFFTENEMQTLFAAP